MLNWYTGWEIQQKTDYKPVWAHWKHKKIRQQVKQTDIHSLWKRRERMNAGEEKGNQQQEAAEEAYQSWHKHAFPEAPVPEPTQPSPNSIRESKTQSQALHRECKLGRSIRQNCREIFLCHASGAFVGTYRHMPLHLKRVRCMEISVEMHKSAAANAKSNRAFETANCFRNNQKPEKIRQPGILTWHLKPSLQQHFQLRWPSKLHECPLQRWAGQQQQQRAYQSLSQLTTALDIFITWPAE